MDVVAHEVDVVGGDPAPAVLEFPHGDFDSDGIETLLDVTPSHDADVAHRYDGARARRNERRVPHDDIDGSIPARCIRDEMLAAIPHKDVGIRRRRGKEHALTDIDAARSRRSR